MRLSRQEFGFARMSHYPFVMPSILSQNIARLLEANGGNQTAFGKRFGVRQPAVSRWLTEGKVPGTAALDAMARLAGVSIQEFQNEDWHPDRPSEAPTPIMMPVSLPSAAALTRMFETMLEKSVPKDQADELAQSLARRLPTALARATNSPAVPVRDTSPDRDDTAQPPAKRHQPRRPEERT